MGAQEIVRNIGEQLVFASPLDLSIGNVMRRVLFIIREEYDEFASQMQSTAALGRSAMMRSSSMLSESLSMFAMEEVDSSYSEPFNIKGPVLEAVRTFIDDLRELHSSISQQALEHIHEHEVVLTFGRSRTVLEFFKAAARKRRFSVIVAETAPSFEGRQTALDLSREGIATTLVTDSAVFALMSRVNKVIIGVRAVLANGGLLAHSGAFLIAMAAKVHHVPLVVLSGLYKFTPLYPSEDQDTFADMGPPTHVLSFDETDTGNDGDVIVQNPSYDYVPPTHVSLYISNQGGYSPPYIYQILAEIYNSEDLPELHGPLNMNRESFIRNSK